MRICNPPTGIYYLYVLKLFHLGGACLELSWKVRRKKKSIIYFGERDIEETNDLVHSLVGIKCLTQSIRTYFLEATAIQ